MYIHAPGENDAICKKSRKANLYIAQNLPRPIDWQTGEQFLK